MIFPIDMVWYGESEPAGHAGHAASGMAQLRVLLG